MGKIKTRHCEGKHSQYMWLFSEYNRLHSELVPLQISHELSTINRVRAELAAIRDDMDYMYKQQDSRCSLPSFNELLMGIL